MTTEDKTLNCGMNQEWRKKALGSMRRSMFGKLVTTKVKHVVGLSSLIELAISQSIPSKFTCDHYIWSRKINAFNLRNRTRPSRYSTIKKIEIYFAFFFCDKNPHSNITSSATQWKLRTNEIKQLFFLV